MRRVLFLAVTVLISLAPAAAGSTSARPNAASLRHLSAEVAHDVLVNSPTRSAFFPEGPYVTMKTGLLPSPSLDWTDRLWAFYQLDVASAHHFLALHGPVHYAGYRASAASVTWIPPRACENLLGYWHLPGVRLEFRGPRGVVSFLVRLPHLLAWPVVRRTPRTEPSRAGRRRSRHPPPRGGTARPGRGLLRCCHAARRRDEGGGRGEVASR